MKTRSNMPLFVVECDNVKTLSNSQIDLLRCGDYLVKKDASGEHAYKVTFKSDTGMCITYHDAYCVETQSYDKIDGVWTYNSEDKTIIAEPQMENIVDADGHKRFVEGDIDLGDNASLENITKGFGKWSLSGSHLMLVLFIQNQTDSDITIGAYTALTANINFPDYVKAKIATLGTATAIDFKKAEVVNPASVLTVKASKTVYFAKASGGTYIIACGESIKLEPNDLTRISFDLLID